MLHEFNQHLETSLSSSFAILIRLHADGIREAGNSAKDSSQVGETSLSCSEIIPRVGGDPWFS